jgi:DNA-binding beta-propeller fold protein YncE
MRAALPALAGLVLVVPAAGAAPRLTYETVLVASPPLERPISVTRDDATGELCVTDGESQALDVFDDSGHHRYRTSDTAALSLPRDASIDGSGGFVFTAVVDGGRTIRRLNFLGEPVPYSPEPPSEEWRPEHLIVTSDGHYVSLDRTGLLVKHDSETGAVLWKRRLAERGSERSDLLGRPAEEDDGSILVPDARGGIVLVVSADGEVLPSFGVRGVKDGELAFPVAVAFGPQGEILVLDQMKHKILLYSAERVWLAEFGSVGFVPGTFYNPLGIAAAPDGRVFVAQGYEGRIQVFRLTDDGQE